MIWGTMSPAGVVEGGPLYQVHTATYQEILEHLMLPSVHQLYSDADFFFQWHQNC